MSDDDLHDRWHRAGCQELGQRVKSRKFLLSVTTTPGEGSAGGPDGVAPEDWEAAAASTEEWLEGLNPTTVDRDDPPAHEVRVGDVQFELSAAPKKAKQGTGSLIANPFPGIATFTGSHSASPAEPFDAE